MGSSLRRQMGVLAVGLLLSVSGCDTTTAPADDLQKRVDTYFDRAAVDIATKEGLAGVAELHYGKVATQTLADGTKVSPWATEPAANPTIRSSCFYLDQETTGGGAHGFGGCGGLDQKVTLNRDGQVLFGSVGSWPANQISLSGGGADMTVDVVNGHFLAPPSLAPPGTAYRVSLFGDGHTTIGTIDSLIAPGSAVPTN